MPKGFKEGYGKENAFPMKKIGKKSAPVMKVKKGFKKGK